MDNIRGSVIFGRLAPEPKLVQRDGLSSRRIPHKFFRHDHIRTSDARKSRGLGETAEFDGHLPGAFDLVDTVRHPGLLYISLICRIKEYHRFVAKRIFDPFDQFVLLEDRPRRIVGKAQINQIDLLIPGR